MLDSLRGVTPERPPENYVREVFDNYSDHFEEQLVEHLQYDAPAQLRRLLNEQSGVATTFSHGLDLGCGTGLSGEAFADRVDILDGIDISEAMLSHARNKQIYRQLFHGSLTEVLRTRQDNYDLVLAADVFVYLGDLAELFRLVRKRMVAHGVFCFSTETGTTGEYALQPTGRFCHCRSYIRDIAADTGFRLRDRQQVPLRRENESWIHGDLWIFSPTG